MRMFTAAIFKSGTMIVQVDLKMSTIIKTQQNTTLKRPQGTLDASEWEPTARQALDLFATLPQNTLLTKDQVQTIAFEKKQAGIKRKASNLDDNDLSNVAACLGIHL